MGHENKDNCCNTSGCCPQPYYCKPPPPCFPSVMDVTKRSPCPSSYTDTSGHCGTQPSSKYGASKPPPCGINYNTSNCSSCCWDSTLCFPVPEECSPGDNVVSINKPSQAPQISKDAAAALAIYNYSLQNVISRGLKFVASYYDWLYCQIGLH